MLTLEEYKAANQPSERRQCIRLGVLGVAFVVLIAATMALALHFKKSDEWAIWYLENVGGHISFFLIGLGCGAAIILVFGGVMWWMGRTDRRDIRLHCPNCRHRLGDWTLIRGICGRCGERALLVPDEHFARENAGPDQQLVTVEEFNAGASVTVKRTLRAVRHACLAMLAYIALAGTVLAIASGPIADWLLRHFGGDRSQRPYAIACLIFFPSVAIWVVALFVALIVDSRKSHDPRIICAQCKAPLFENRYWVVATRQCTRCKNSILADPEPATPAEPGDTGVGEYPKDSSIPRPMQSPAAFRAASISYFRWNVSFLFLVFVAPVVGVALIFPRYEKPLRQMLGETAATALFISALILAICLGGLMGWFIDSRLRRKYHLDCPHCGKHLERFRGLVLSTRRCVHCGKRALAENTAAEPAA